jgi:hypothetical protein
MKYGQGDFEFMAFCHLLMGVLAYKYSIPLKNLHDFVHCLEILKPMHVACMHIQFQLYVPLDVEHPLSTVSQ